MNKKFFIFAISLVTVTMIFAQDIKDASAKYHKSENAIERKNALHTISYSKVAKLNTPSASEKNDAEILLNEAFNDPNFTVVETAVQKTGELKLTSLDRSLVSLYALTTERFGAYAERIRCAIYVAAGKLNTDVSKSILIDALKKNNGRNEASFILDAIRSTGDTKLITSVNAYVSRLTASVNSAKARGDNPFIYSEIQGSIQLAQNVITNLSTKGAN
jgi:hypothetical protein